jgi:hypothetical protein
MAKQQAGEAVRVSSNPSEGGQLPPPIIEEKQKLVTIYLDNVAYAKGKTLVGSFADKHGLVEEHLSQFLRAGWHIKQIHGFGGNSDSLAVRGWVLVLLERV